jgi:hypothetical protein
MSIFYFGGWHMDHTELVDRFQEIVKNPLNDSDEVVQLLCETNWVRILVVRNAESPEVASIEVEMALPECVIEPPVCGSEAKVEDAGARSFVERTIDHLRYLLNLEKAGLSLGVVSKEGIWSAYTIVKKNPLASFFKSLIPPSVS